MSFDDDSGPVDPQALMSGMIGDRMPEAVDNNGQVDPQTVLNRLIRKGMAPRQQPKSEPADDFGSFGKTKDEIDAQPPEDFSQFGSEAPEETKPPKQDNLGVSGNVKAFGKGAARGAVESVGSAMQGAGGAMARGEQIPQSTMDNGLPLPTDAGIPLPATDKNAAPIPGSKPIKENPLFQAGGNVKKFAEEKIPMSPAEQESIGGQTGAAIGGSAGAMAIGMLAGMVGGPAAGMAAGSAVFAAQSAGETFDAALKKGATDEQAAKAAGLSGTVGAALGTLPLGAVLSPIKSFGPGLYGFALGKLAQFGLNGLVFTGVGEAQQAIQSEIAKAYYDKDAKYDPSLKRAMAEFLAGGAFGLVHKLGRASEAAEAAAQGEEGASSLPPPGEAGARTQTGAGPEAPPGTGGAGAAEPKEPFESTFSAKTRSNMERAAAYYKEHSDSDIASWSDDQLKDYLNVKFGFGSKGGDVGAAADAVAEEEGPQHGTREAPVDIKTADDVHKAAAAADQDHSPEQGEANNIQRGHAKWNGLDITIEAPAGGVRRGTNPKTGEPWETTHTVPYGYIKGTEGADGMHVDAFMGPNPQRPTVYVIDERDTDNGDFRQHKAMIGFNGPTDAMQAYLGTSTKQPHHIGGMRALSVDEFKDWLKTGDTKAPLSEAMGEPKPAPSTAETIPEVGPEHHAAVEGALREAGVDPVHVRQSDIARAAEIHAEEGAPPDQAFQVSVLRGLVEDGHITPEAVKEAVGDEAAKELLESGIGAQRGVGLETSGTPARGPAAAAEGELGASSPQSGAQPSRETGQNQRGQNTGAEQPAGTEANRVESGVPATGHPENGRAAVHATGGVEHAEANAGRAHREGESTGYPAAGTKGFTGTTKTPAHVDLEERDRGEVEDIRDDLHSALDEAKIPLESVPLDVEDRAIAIMANPDFKGHALDALEAGLIQVERAKNDLPEQLWLDLDISKEALHAIDELKPSEAGEGVAAESGEGAKEQGERPAAEGEPASGAGKGTAGEAELAAKDEDDVEGGDWGHETMAAEKVFPAPAKTVRAGSNAKGDFIAIDAAKARLQAWKDHAQRIAKEEDHSNEVILSLFDRTGTWSKPYKDAGYQVATYDITNGDDLVRFVPVADIDAMKEKGFEIVGVLAAPPCTSYAVSGARWWADQHDKANVEMVEKKYGGWAAEYFDTPLEYANTLVAVTQAVVELANPTKFHVLENPVGRIAKINDLPPPTLTFDPNNYGDPYTKKTLLWGDFNPELPLANVEPTEGSKIANLRGDNIEEKLQRSETPEGFAYAFFMANNTSKLQFEEKPDEAETSERAETKAAAQEAPAETPGPRALDRQTFVGRLLNGLTVDTPGGDTFWIEESPKLKTWVVKSKENGSTTVITTGPAGPRGRVEWSQEKAAEQAADRAFGAGGNGPLQAPVDSSHIKSEEAPHGVPPSLSGSDARTGAEDVQRPLEVGGTGPIRSGESPAGQPAVSAAHEGRPETAERLPEGALRAGSGGTGEGGPHPIPERTEPAEGRSERATERAADSVVGENFRIEPGALDEARGWKTKARDNVAALELAKQIESEARPATHAEQKILARYVGWGGIKGAFPDADGNYGKGFEEIGAKLKDLLAPDEYKTAQRSIQYAHYTAEKIVRAMWSAVQRLSGWPERSIGSAFEPGMGIGNFAGMMPPDMHVHYQGLEFDATTARIAKLLYPQYGVRHADYTRVTIPENHFDLAIGNPPFADVVIKSDPKYAKQGMFLHDYFFAKTLDSVRPGGLLAFISSAGTMNKLDPKAREYLADRADLVGAIRLPSDAFKENAGTEVTTDIVFLRKRFPSEPAGDRAWTQTKEVALPDREGKTVKGEISGYFADHPEMVLGNQGWFDKLYEGRYAVHAKPGQDLASDLAAAIEKLPRGVVKSIAELAGEHAPLDFETTEKKEGTFYLGKNGDLHQIKGGAGFPIARRGAGAEGALPQGHIERIKGLIPIRDSLREVYSANLADDAAKGDKARKALNAHYDKYVAQFGPINKADIQRRRPTSIQAEGAREEAREEARYAGVCFDEGSFDPSKLIARGAGLMEVARARKTAREEAIAAGTRWDEGEFNPDEMPDVIVDKRPNIDPFMDDPESYRLRAIEHYDDATFAAKKSSVFFENTITRQKAPEIKSTNDALLYALNQKGRVDIPEIATLIGKSEPEVIEDLGDAIFKEPGTLDSYVTRDDYLSGNVLEKLAVAKAQADKNPEYRRNVTALEAAQPTPLAPSQITATMGMPWIPEETIDKFGRDELGLEGFSAKYIPTLAQWVTKGDKRSAAAVTTWGTDRRAGPDLVEDVLNRRPVKIYDVIKNAEGKDQSVLNIEATQAAQDKAQAIRDKFDGWIWSDPERADSHAALYNQKYNNLVVRNYDGSYLTTPGISTNWSWRPHQKRVIARIIQSGNTYIAHAVGAGKTSEYIGAGMEMRRLGLVKKPLYVVPNHMLAQFTKEFYEQYPTAKIAVADERRFHTDRRKQFIANVANEDLDGIVITHSAFGMIPVSNEFADSVVQGEIEHYREVLSQIPKDQEHRVTRSRIEKQIERMEQRLTGRAGTRKDQVITFEEMGADFLFIDEAHMFRKLDFTTQMGNVKGISPEGSQKSWDLYVKSLYLDSVNPQRNMVLGSGTPVTNTMAELFTVSRYLQRHELEKRGLAQFDAWASSFGEPVTELEQDAAGGYKPVTRFSRFVNVAELSAMVRQMMDVVTSKQLEQYVVRPKIKGGKRMMRLAEKSPGLERYQQSLAERMRLIQARKGPPKKGDDIMLSVINDGRHAAIDMRLVGAKKDPNSKLSLMVNDVFDHWKATKKQKFYGTKEGAYDLSKPINTGPATQMIFVNLGLSGARHGFAVPDFIRAELVRRGVPKNEIAYIYDYKSHVQKQRLFNDMNEGKVRILIGSTAKMATGVNAQRRLSRINNMDPLWYPSDDEQRNGRGIRQGNTNPEIEIADYGTKGTYDSTMWGMMERKARFIQAFFEGDPSLRNMDDLGEASQYEQAKAITTNDPRLIELTELKQNLEKANRRWAAFDQELHAIKSRRAGARGDIEFATKRVANIEKDIKQRQDISGDKFTAKLGNKTYSKRTDFGEALLSTLDKLATKENNGEHFAVGDIGGFPLVATVHKSYGGGFASGAELRFNGNSAREVKISASDVGTVRSIEAVIGGLDADRDEYEKIVKTKQKFLAESEEAAKAVFTGKPEIDDLTKKVRALQAELAKAASTEVHPPEVNAGTISSLDALQSHGIINELEPFTSRVPFAAMAMPKKPDWYYSAVARAVEARGPAKASPQQWLSTIRNTPGVKPEELQWLGLTDWLRQQPASITKQEVQDFVRANSIEVQQVVLSGSSSDPDNFLSPRYSGYQLPGGKEYSELLLTLPEKAGERGPKGWGDTAGGTSDTANFRSAHWEGQPNVLAHIRFNDRTIGGKKTLFIEEVQSDWHQKGKRHGYVGAEPSDAVLGAEMDRIAREQIAQEYELQRGAAIARDRIPAGLVEGYLARNRDNIKATALSTISRGGVPDAPFKTTWPELAMKRMIRYAAENGYDQVAWTPGETQAARYDLSKHVDHIGYNKNSDGTFDLSAFDGPGRDGKIVHSDEAMTLEKVEATFGKDIAKMMADGHGRKRRVLEDDPHSTMEAVLEGKDFKVGGEGMLRFYDDILPAAVNKLVKKYGTKVGASAITRAAANVPPGEQFDTSGGEITNQDGFHVATFDTQEEADRYVDELRNGSRTPVHFVPITPQLRDAAISQGFPLFQARPQPSRGLSDEYEGKRLEAVAERRRLLGATAKLHRIQIEASLANLIHRVTGNAVKVQFEDTIPLHPDAAIGWGRTAETIGGKYLPLADVIEVALSDPLYPDKADTALHESWHAVEDHFINDKEMALFKREEPRLREAAGRYYGLTPDEAAKLADYEVRAIAFQAYSSEREKGGYGEGLHIGVRAIFEKLRRLFQQIANYLRSLGFNTVDDIFAKTFEGKMAERPSRKLDEGKPSRLAEAVMSRRPVEEPAATMAKPVTKIIAAAIDADGRIFTGINHADAFEAAQRTLGPDNVSNTYDGFITSEGHFVDRETAWKIANRSKQPLDRTFTTENQTELHADSLGAWDDADIARNNDAVTEATRDPLLPHPQELLNVDGKAAFLMVVDKADNAVLQAVRYKKAADSDFHHNFYLRESVREKVDSGEAVIVGANQDGLFTATAEPMPQEMRRALQKHLAGGSEPSVAMARPRRAGASGSAPRSLSQRIRDRIADLFDRQGNKLVEYAQDLSHPVRRLQDELEARRKAPLSDVGDFYTRKRLYPGRVGNEVRVFNEAHLDPLVKYMKANGISLAQAGDYVYAKHVRERNQTLGAHYPPTHPFFKAMSDPTLVGASGRSQQWADGILREAARVGKTASFERVAAAMQAIRNDIINRMVNGHLITAATAAEWRARYEHYVDLRGFEDEPDEAPSDYREPARFNVRGKEVKQAFGRQSKADNPVVNMLDQAYRTIDRVERNRYLHAVWNALGRMNADNPGSVSDIVSFDRGKPKKIIDPNTGLVREVGDSSFAMSPNTVTTKINGMPHYLVFKNRDIAEAVKRMVPETMSGIAQGLLRLENKLKALWTHYSPDFLFRHFIFRYPIEGTLNSFEQKETGEHRVAKYIKESFPFLGTASKAIFASNKGVTADSAAIREMQALYERMRKAGGAMMFRQSRDMDLLREHLQTQLMALKGKPVMTAREKWRRAVEAMDVVTNALDNALRLAAFASAVKQGKTDHQAALAAREATVDFQLKGKWANGIGLWFPFGNIAIQTGARMTKAVYRSRIMRQVFGSTMLAGFLTAAFNYLIGGNDKDGVPFFEKIPEWERRLNFIVLNPFVRDEKGRPEKHAIPMPYNWAFPLMIGYAMGTRVFGKESIRKTLTMVGKSALEVLTPFGQEENMAALLAPELSRPAIYIATNENYNGIPIHANPDYQKAPNSWSGKKDIGGRVRTGEGWKYIAEGINSATGGSRKKSGWLDFYPEDIRQVVDYVGGSQRRLVQNIYQSGKSIAKGEAPDPTHIPLVRVIFGNDYDAANRTLLYEKLDRQKHPWAH